MNLIKLLQDYSIPFLTEGKNVGRGWINLNCPFCDDPSEHLGFNLEANYFHCWRCGWHPYVETVARLIGTTIKETITILQKYGFDKNYTQPSLITNEPNKKPFRLPSNVEPLLENHRKYLIQRRFDPDQLIPTWQLLGTGPVSLLDGIDFKHRIIIPILWKGRQVSFTSRDVTNKHPIRYLSCPKDRELIPHKTILYGRSDQWSSTGVCVEGPTDVWRLGVKSFATFGIEFTNAQVREMKRAFRRIFVMYDNEPQAQLQADRLVAELRFRKVEAIKFLCNAKDPASLEQSEADYIVKQLTT